MAKVYKKNNPNGLIYCGLDANSGWMDRIEWYNPDYKWFMDNCDVFATSCTAMAELLTKKWHRKVDVLTNGYYDFFGMNLENSRFDERENVIFTAARLGIKQKATDLLLNAFALIANDIQGWTLRLAGPVADEFIPFKEKFFEEHPELKGRVLFLGDVTDRKELAMEYKRAKIFALPSEWEGGTPNAASEALYSGCVMAVTKIDAWEDCTGKGRCGAAAEVGDLEGYARILKELCLNTNLEKMSRNAREYAKEMFNMEKNVLWLFNRLKERTVQ
jgi:glycosyltransferase involved in cell wall biosynthesis